MKNKFITAILLIPVLLTGCSNQTDLESSYEYTTDFNALDYVELCDYTSIPISVDPSILEVTDDDVEEEIQNVLLNYASNIYINYRTYIKDGDIVVFDYTAVDEDGIEYDGSKIEIILGEESFPEELEQEFIGRNVNELFECSINYDENWSNETLAGKTVEYSIKILGIKEEYVPKLTDEFVKQLDIDEVNTVEEYYLYENESLTEYRQYIYELYGIDEVLDYLIENSTIKSIPEKFTETLSDIYFDYYTQQGILYGYDTYSDYLITTKEDIDSIEDADKYIYEEIGNSKNALIVTKAIFENEGMSLDGMSEDILDYINELGYGSIDEVEQSYMTYEYIEESFIQDYVASYILWNFTYYDESIN